MDSTEELLRAFIKASGYEIKALSSVFISGIKHEGDETIVPVRLEDSVTHKIDYEVTKKKEDYSLVIHRSELWCFGDAVVGDTVRKISLDDCIVTEDMGEYVRVKRLIQDVEEGSHETKN